MPSRPSAGDDVTADDVANVHNTDPLVDAIAYTLLSPEPTYMIPVPDITGDDCMEVPSLRVQREATVGPAGP